ncbi:ProQ/FINO family protein [Caldimonas tepidiphila]|uniref:ProQ/FINO family protein n=1 Tax=Caldimonas tepidiphila TaxID=2315841 RepID=UPI001476096C|nr:ProQ/FinO family protein [Caldimonas tepidiphila]
MNPNDDTVPASGDTPSLPTPEAPAAPQPAPAADACVPDASSAGAPAPAGEPPEAAQEPALPAEAAEAAEAAPRRAEGAEMSVKACAAKLRELYPALFGGRPKPLKLRIQQDINARAPGVFPKQTLSAFLRRYTMTDAYLQAVSTQTQRFDLDGQPAGELSEEHRRLAAETIKQRRGREDERLAAERAAEAERLQRASLLAAFETTTLTRENFCALKGVEAAQLDALLAQASEERRQRKQFLTELLEAFRASGQNVPAFAASRRMHPAQLDRLLREASGDTGGERGRGAPRDPRRDGGRREGGDRRDEGRREGGGGRGRGDERGGARGPRNASGGPSGPRSGKPGGGRPPRA